VPRPQLSRNKIVAAAIKMADEKGLGAVTLRGLAKRLGVHVTSLYNHIPTKEALFTEMMTDLMLEAGLPVEPNSWQDWIRRFAEAMRILAGRHPGAFHLFHQGPALGLEAMDSLESAVKAFSDDGFDAVSTWGAVKAVNVTVLGLTLDDLARHAKPAIEVDIEQLPRERFPHIFEIRTVAENADTFELVLDTLIEGISAMRH